MALRIEAQLHGDGSSFFAMMGKAEVASRSLAGQFLGPLKSAIAGAFTIGAASALARSTIQMASHFRDLADQLGVNVEWLQAFSVAARQAGATEDDLAKMMLQVNRARGIAAGGGARGELAMSGFSKLGFSSDEVANAPLQKFMEKIFKAFESGNAQSLLPIMQGLGIRASAKLSAAFQDGILKTADDVRAAGGVLAEDVIDQLDEIGDKFALLKTRMLVGVAPAIERVAEGFLKVWNALRIGWVFLRNFASDAPPEAVARDLGNKFDEIAGETVGSERLQAARKRMRRKRENSGPGFIPSIATGGRTGYSDSLTGIGNFLGAGLASSLANVGEKTNQLLMRSNKLLETIAANINELGMSDIGVP